MQRVELEKCVGKVFLSDSDTELRLADSRGREI